MGLCHLLDMPHSRISARQVKLTMHVAPEKLVSSLIRDLLRVRLAEQTSDMSKKATKRRLDIHTLIAKGRHLRLSKLHVLVEDVNVKEAEKWAQAAMQVAYGGRSYLRCLKYPCTDSGVEIDAKPFRRILLLINPTAGKSKARATAKSTIVPILEAAGCTVDARGESLNALR